MAEVLELYRAGQIEPAPITIFDVADVAQAYFYFSSKDRVGKVVASMEDPQSRIQVSSGLVASTYSSLIRLYR